MAHREQMIEIVVPCFDQDDEQHAHVLKEAFDLFQDKSTVRGDMWRQFPLRDKIRELRERVSRMEMVVNPSLLAIGKQPDVVRAELRSNAIDTINYAVFLVKQIDEGAEL